MKCPSCDTELSSKIIDSEKVYYCDFCKGLLIHKHQLNHMIREIHGDIELCSIEKSPDKEEREIRYCPECGDIPMKKINFLEFSDIFMDYCSKCGSFWLDKGELDQIHAYAEELKDNESDLNDITATDILHRLSGIIYRIYH